VDVVNEFAPTENLSDKTLLARERQIHADDIADYPGRKEAMDIYQ
jgi:hypothetical protein